MTNQITLTKMKKDNSHNKIEKKNKVESRVIFFPEVNNNRRSNYIKFSNYNIKEGDATVGSKVIHSPHERVLLSGRIPGSNPGRGASSLFSKNLNFIFNK